MVSTFLTSLVLYVLFAYRMQPSGDFPTSSCLFRRPLQSVAHNLSQPPGLFMSEEYEVI